ncbi:hypothetical protein, partial [Mycobacterium avium]|uniref:hypothetical protein n=1 Tax=Mycobacterium avium TaxID=1764 RepID=UPI0005B63638
MADESDTPADEEKSDAATQLDTDEGDDQDQGRVARWRELARRRRLSRAATVLAVGAVMVAALAGLSGWLGYRAYQQHDAQARRNLFVATARQGAVNLTTINYTQVDRDVQRILDSATGAFRDEFEQRSKPFAEVVKAAQSKSEGTVTDAGLESQRGDSAQVLVAGAGEAHTPRGG